MNDWDNHEWTSGDLGNLTFVHRCVLLPVCVCTQVLDRERDASCPHILISHHPLLISLIETP